ncbi:hypothetical protein [Brachyspira pulli]|uniref:hypothetical protein n=1 Tax=Brachyspira pulli TaxID=310721 RepID=UPI003005F899
MENFFELNTLFKIEIYNFQILENTFHIMDAASKMECDIKLLSKSICTTNIEGNNKFNYIRMAKCADAVIIRKNQNNNLDLHIIELKKDIHDKDLDKLYWQFLGAYIRVMSVLVAYSQVNNIDFYLISDKKINTSNINIDQGTSQKKNKNYNRTLFDESKVKNQYRFNVYPFNLTTLNITKYNLQDNIDIII